MEMAIDTQHLIAAVDKKTNEKYYLFMEDNEWKRITEEEYKQILGAKNNDTTQ